MVELVVRLVFSLSVVLGLLFLITRLGAKKFRGHTSAPIRVVHRQALSRSSAVSVVSVGTRLLVLGTTEHKISLLTELEPHEFPTALKAALDDAELDDTAGALATPEVAVPVAAVRPLPVAAPARPVVPAAYTPAASFAAAMAQAGLNDLQDSAPALEQAALVQASVEQVAMTAQPLAPVKALNGRKAARAQKGAQDGALAGSLLSAQTWKQAFAAATARPESRRKGQVAS